MVKELSITTEQFSEIKHRNIYLIGSGWKPISMIDVYNSVTFTLWLCGCNLKCPFCHNWMLAINHPSTCRYLDINKLIEELESARILIDYLHITGGEPLIQYRELEKILSLAKNNIGVNISINSNFTLYKPLKHLIDSGIVDHLATDLKIPYDLLYGHSKEVADTLWKLFIKSLALVSEYNVPLELRIPVMKNINIKIFRKYLAEALDKLDKHNNYYVIIQPLLGPPITNPRNPEWCRKYCDPDKHTLYLIKNELENMGIQRLIVRETLSFG